MLLSNIEEQSQWYDIIQMITWDTTFTPNIERLYFHEKNECIFPNGIYIGKYIESVNI